MLLKVIRRGSIYIFIHIHYRARATIATIIFEWLARDQWAVEVLCSMFAVLAVFMLVGFWFNYVLLWDTYLSNFKGGVTTHKLSQSIDAVLFVV